MKKLIYTPFIFLLFIVLTRTGDKSLDFFNKELIKNKQIRTENQFKVIVNELGVYSLYFGDENHHFKKTIFIIFVYNR